MPADEPQVALNASDEGRVLADRYRLVERIDAGGAGEVWRARDERLDRDVAVKILGADADEAFRQRFADEARRAASVQHPNVVTVFDEGREGGDSFMVMEFVRGKTLRDMIAARGPLSPIETARLIARVAAALDAAHEAGVIHCDVKPANIIVDEQGRAKLTDFGIARAARGPREHELIGTARYIAPERIEGEAPTERSDIYSLGLVAYELLAGQPAYAEMETEDLLRERLVGPPPSLRTARVGVSNEVDAVIRTALARAPEDRYPSAGTFARELLGAVERGDATGVIATPRRPLRRGRGFSANTTVALLAIIAVLVGTLVVFASFQVRAPAAPSTTPARSGPAGLVTPNLVGRPAQDAVDQLLAAGFGRVAYDVDAGASRTTPCTVARQDPAAGTSFTRGASAMIWYVPGSNCVKG
ncbi:MAG TPA: serine/threonine protein kinase [Methylomirabilota bacterium]|nr:serine/threonine protein kinase [Methylomirabilota bacterium]